MPANSDHIRRDAEHAARLEVSILISKYVRRLNEGAKARILDALASDEGGVIDGTALGREAAAAAIATYIGSSEVHQAIEAGSPAIESYTTNS